MEPLAASATTVLGMAEPTRDLDILEQHLQNGEWNLALDAALNAWRTHRSESLADLIDLVSDRVVTPLKPAQGGAFHEWWLKHASNAGNAERKVLLNDMPAPWVANRATFRSPTKLRLGLRPALSTHPWVQRFVDELLPWRNGLVGTVVPALNENQRLEHLAAILRWPDDPRSSAVLTNWLIERNSHRQSDAPEGVAAFYRFVANRLVDLGDTRFVRRLDGQEELSQLLRQRKLANLPRVDALLAKLREPSSQQIEEPPVALLEAIAASPDSDGPRAVLADWYLDRHNVQGELIALQLEQARKPKPATAKKVKSILQANQTQWLGPLAQIVNLKASVFHRGLLFEVVVGAPRVRAEQFTVEHWLLRTVEKVVQGGVTSANFVCFLESKSLRFNSLEVHDPIVLRDMPHREFSTLRLKESAEQGLDEVDAKNPSLRHLIAEGDERLRRLLDRLCRGLAAGQFKKLRKLELRLEQEDRELAEMRAMLGASIEVVTGTGSG